MKIEINIIAPGLESAINNLATAIAGNTKTGEIVTGYISSTGQELGESKTTADDLKESPAAEEMTPAQKLKAELSQQIIALGGTPPESGAVKKYQAALDALKTANNCYGDTRIPQDGSVDQHTTEEPATEATETPADSPEWPTLEEVRMLAGYVVRNQNDDDEKCGLGKAKVRACLKKVRAESITALFETSPEKAPEFVTLLERNAGKTLSEVVAETTAE